MKVLQVNAIYGSGSTGVIVEDIHKLCLESGITSYVAYSNSNYPDKQITNGYKIGGVIDKKLHALLSRINGKQAYFSCASTQKFLNYIVKIKPDVVILHNLHSNFINLNMLLKFLSKRNIKTIIFLHDCWFYTGGCFHYTSVGCSKWQKNCGKCPKKHADTPAYFLDSSAKILKQRKQYIEKITNLSVIGVSEWITKEAEKSFLNGKKTTIYNGVDTEVFKFTASNFKRKYGLENKTVVLGPATKWLQQINKRVFEEVVNGLPEDCVMVILGCNKKQAKALPKGVLALPYINNRNELCKVYSAADVFVNCTREDSLSLINVEVQSCGTPVITFGNTGANETVNNISSFTVETGNAQEMLDKIKHIKEVGKEAFSKENRKWVEAKFCKHKNYSKLIKEIEEIFKM